MGVDVSLTLLPVLRILCFLLGCLTRPCYKSLCLVLLYLVMLWLISLGGLWFSEEKWRRTWGRGLGGVKGGDYGCDVLYEKRIKKVVGPKLRLFPPVDFFFSQQVDKTLIKTHTRSFDIQKLKRPALGLIRFDTYRYFSWGQISFSEWLRE